MISDRATNSQVAPRVLLEVEWHFGENGVEPGQREGNAMAQRRTSKSQVRRPEPSDKMRDDLVSMLLAEQMDFAADYVRRGRAHRNLTDAELREEWKAAFRAHSQEPRPGLLRRTLQDFQAELDLRNGRHHSRHQKIHRQQLGHECAFQRPQVSSAGHVAHE